MANEVSTNQVLANEVLAPLPEVALSEPDYRAFCAALEASARGRAFLAEYARRNRQADTETVLTALDRLEELVRGQAATTEADRIRQELRALLAAMSTAQPVIDASAAAIKAAKLAALIGFVQHRIESIVANEPSPLPAEVAALVLPDEALAEPARAHLAMVPPAEEPELPIPAPAAGPQPPIALVQTTPEAPPLTLEMIQPMPEVTPPVQDLTPAAQDVPPTAQIITPRSAAIIPEVNLFDGAPAKPATLEPAVAELAVVEPVVAATIIAEPAIIETQVTEIAAVEIVATPPAPLEQTSFAPTFTPLIPAQTETALVTEIAVTPPPAVFELTLPPPAVKAPASPPVDPLAHIMALSDEERIALFS